MNTPCVDDPAVAVDLVHNEVYPHSDEGDPFVVMSPDDVLGSVLPGPSTGYAVGKWMVFILHGLTFCLIIAGVIVAIIMLSEDSRVYYVHPGCPAGTPPADCPPGTSPGTPPDKARRRLFESVVAMLILVAVCTCYPFCMSIAEISGFFRAMCSSVSRPEHMLFSLCYIMLTFCALLFVFIIMVIVYIDGWASFFCTDTTDLSLESDTFCLPISETAMIVLTVSVCVVICLSAAVCARQTSITRMQYRNPKDARM